MLISISLLKTLKGGGKIERLHDGETTGNEGDGDHKRKHTTSDQRENEGKKGGDVCLLRNNSFFKLFKYHRCSMKFKTW